jgi:hypothetical protein
METQIIITKKEAEDLQAVKRYSALIKAVESIDKEYYKDVIKRYFKQTGSPKFSLGAFEATYEARN